ncbi:MAG: metal-binding protein [Gammaproteobacteria bacterium HGW-Gammaproteobacteria-6]|nr:MAG: metal-binding protein [Gammaproteobacteria bacterium HGW-Gammaproteobacteria-6]
MQPLVASLALATSLLFSGLAQAADPLNIDVYRDPNCGCCKAWIEHLEENGFSVTDHEETDMTSVKQHLGVPGDLASCHTAVIDGRFVEGHVPAADIRLMQQRPSVLGIAVPGMPVGSPGMEIGDRQDSYQVISLDEAGNRSVQSTYP